MKDRMNGVSPKTMVEIRKPQLLTFSTVLVLNAFGFLAFVPVALSFAYVSVTPFGALTFVIPLVTLGVVTFFLPFAFGNPYIRYLVAELPRTGATRNFIVQLTCRPRRQVGPRGVLEDADDIGWLGVAGGHLEFRGDSFSLKIPRAGIRTIRLRSIGWRGFFLTHRTAVQVEGLEGVEVLEFTERASWVLLSSRQLGREIQNAVESLRQ